MRVEIIFCVQREQEESFLNAKVDEIVYNSAAKKKLESEYQTCLRINCKF